MSGASEKPVAKAIAFATLVLFGACSFPEHTFVEDSQFYGSGATGGASGADGGSGTGGGSGAEDCTNGADDDGDGDIDCADTDCQPGHACFPGVPAGWEGPVAVYRGSDSAPDCQQAGGFPTPLYNAKSGLDEGTPECPTCECTTPTPTCTANYIFYSSSSCGAGSCWGSGLGCPGTAITATPGQCKPQGFCQPGPTSVLASAITPTGSCTAESTGDKVIPTPTWSEVVRACGGAQLGGQGCGTGMCLPKPSSPFGPTLCIYAPGDVTCPTAFAEKSLAHQDFSDTRDCSVCACGTLTGVTCTDVTLDFYTDDGCTANKQSAGGVSQCLALTADPDVEQPTPQCQNQPADFRSLMMNATVNGTGSCPPIGGQLTGEVTLTETVTICCL